MESEQWHLKKDGRGCRSQVDGKGRDELPKWWEHVKPRASGEREYNFLPELLGSCDCPTVLWEGLCCEAVLRKASGQGPVGPCRLGECMSLYLLGEKSPGDEKDSRGLGVGSI